jgi:transcriptional regulator with XRE-family HTH domain
VHQETYSVKTSNFSPAGGATEPKLALENRLARLLRALPPYKRGEFSERTGIHPTTLSHYEAGTEKPSAADLEAMARAASMTIDDALKHLHLYDSRSGARLRPGRGAESVFARLGEEIRARAEDAYQNLLRLPGPASEAENRQRLDDQIALLRVLDEPARSAVVKSTRLLQTKALAGRVAEEAAQVAPGNAAESAAWARLANEIAQLAAPEE